MYSNLTKYYDYGIMIIVMQQIVSKAQFKAQALEYLREVENKKQPLIITHAGKPVVQIIPYQKPEILASLKKSVTFFKDPIEPVDVSWETFQ